GQLLGALDAAVDDPDRQRPLFRAPVDDPCSVAIFCRVPRLGDAAGPRFTHRGDCTAPPRPVRVVRVKVFVTGGTGFIGGAVVRQLRARGDDVVALVRNPAKGAPLEELGCTLVAGDLSDERAIRAG